MFFSIRSIFQGFVCIAVVSMVVSFFGHSVKATQSQALSSLSVSVADRSKSASTTYTLTLKSSVAIPSDGGRVRFQFNGPSGYGSGSSTVDFNYATLASSTSPSSLAIYSRDWNGLTLSTSSTIAADTTLTLVINNVTNPSRGGYYIAHMWTQNYSSDLDGVSAWGGDYNAPYVEIGTNTNLVGTITDSSGNPIPFATVNVSDSNWTNYYYAYTDKNGAYGIGDMTAGTYTFSIYYGVGYNTGKTYFAPANSSITIASSGATTKNASFLAATKTLSGKVTVGSASGAAVTNGSIYASKVGGNGYVNKTLSSDGSYSLTLTGGSWTIGIYPNTWPADWKSPNNNSETVSFTDDTSVESTTKNFFATALNSTLTGMITYPDGTKPSNQWGFGLSLTNSNSEYFSAQMDSSGNFSAKLAEGTYSVNGWSSDSRYSFPKVANFSIAANETKDIGAIKLVEKTDSITGKVSDDLGSGVSGASISAWKNDGTYDSGYTTSATDGTYTIKVIPGTYSVSAYPQWNSGYVYSGKPSSVTVTSGTPATKNFTFQRATNTLNVTVTDPDGNTLTSVNSWVSAGDGSQDWGNVGNSITNGIGTIKLPKGTWDVQVYLYISEYSSPDPQKVTFSGDNEVKAITLKATKNNATIHGTIYDEDGNKITGKWISIYATKGKYGSWQSATFDQTAGTYAMKVSAGTWNLGWWIDQSLGYSSGTGQDVEIEIGDSQTKTYDITFKKANATISGKATKADGSAMQWAWINADTRDPNEKKSATTNYYMNGASSNASGNYTLRVPAGTYFVGANMWVGSGYINPKRQKVTVEADKTATLDMVFRAADGSISGTVKKDGSGTGAFVTAWGEDGAYSEANSDNQGAYALAVSKGTRWHITARHQSGSDIYKSKEVLVDLSDSTSDTAELELVKQTYTMPDAQTITFDPTKQQSIALDDGTTITIPANSIATSGTVTVVANPNSELAEEADAKPLAYGYDLTATDQTNKEISSFKGNITIETKYTDAQVADSQVQSEDELIVGYYDKAVGTWIELPNCTTNDSENTVTCQVNHFTTFAIVTASDSTPPSAPSNITATAGDGVVTLTWTKPTDSDYKSISIYRSAISGTLGDKIVSSVTDSSYKNSNLTNGTTYYFTVRAVDNSGNESTNATQISSNPGSLEVTSTSGTSGTVVIVKKLPKTGASSAWLGLGLIMLLGGMAILRKTKVS